MAGSSSSENKNGNSLSLYLLLLAVSPLNSIIRPFEAYLKIASLQCKLQPPCVLSTVRFVWKLSSLIKQPKSSHSFPMQICKFQIILDDPSGYVS